MFRLRVDDSFAAAHQLRGYRGRCENLHGHNWRVELRVEGERLDDLGMLVDFGILKGILGRELERLDHSFLNDTPPFDRINPTSENLARHLFDAVGRELPDGVRVASVAVWESDRCAAAYDGSDHGHG